MNINSHDYENSSITKYSQLLRDRQEKEETVRQQ